MNRRRQLIRTFSIACLTAAAVACCAGIVAAATSLWECNYCHQQYQGASPPPFVKCPAKDMKQNHWWIKKS